MKILRFTSLLVLASTLMVFAETSSMDTINTINRAMYDKDSEKAWEAVRMAQAASDTPRAPGVLSSRTSLSMRVINSLAPLFSSDQDLLRNEALLDALNINRSNYDRSSPETYMVSMLFDENLIARSIALRSLYKSDLSGLIANSMLDVATVSEPVKNALLKMAAEDDWLTTTLKPSRQRSEDMMKTFRKLAEKDEESAIKLEIALSQNPNHQPYAKAEYIVAPFREKAIKILNANGVDICLDENKLAYDSLVWLGKRYLESKTDEKRKSVFNLLTGYGMDSTHPEVAYAQRSAKEAAGVDSVYGKISFDSQELQNLFKFLAEATPEMWKKKLEGTLKTAVDGKTLEKVKDAAESAADTVKKAAEEKIKETVGERPAETPKPEL